MSFIWPAALAAILLVPLGVALYVAIDRRRKRLAAALVGPGLAGAGAGARRRGGLRTRIPAALFVTAFAVLAVALARPQAAVSLPRAEGTVVLAFDVSASMTATDIEPTRMDAAKAAAKAFVEQQPAGVIIGVVAFSDAGISVQVPTSDQAAVLAAIERITPSRGTSIGQGIQSALNAIAQSEADTPPSYYSNRSPAPTVAPTPVPAGSHGSAAIVLLSDGENNERPDPVAVAQTAADQGIRIDTVGIGSAAGTTLDLNGFQVHTQLDEATLQQIASVTGGTYRAAADADQLNAVYRDLGTQLVFRTEQIEVTALLAAAGVLLFVVGGVLSLAWSGRLP
jgi:Ca-activated chloride channel family protein